MANVDFSAEIEAFRSAIYGEDVRGALVEIAEALEAAINGSDVTLLTENVVKNRGILSAGEDFDDYKNNGVWGVASASDAATMTNCPASLAGRLVIYRSTASTSEASYQCSQLYLTAGGTVWSRGCTSSGWGEWHKLLSDADLTIGSAALPDGATTMTLTVYDTLGIWYVQSALADKTVITDIPEEAIGYLVTLKSTSAQGLVQIYLTLAGHIYTRYKTSSGWAESWKQIVDSSSIGSYGYTEPQGQLSEATDFDALTASGSWYVSNTIAAKSAHSPSEDGGVLTTMRTRPWSATYLVQTFVSNGSRTGTIPNINSEAIPQVFVRYKSGTWTRWHRMIGLVPEVSPMGRALGSAAELLDGLAHAAVGEKLYIEKGSDTTSKYAEGDPIGGVIYSSVWREGEDVLWNHTPETYFSAMANPASIMYTSYAPYGIHNAHAPMGLVCSSYVSWVLGMDHYRQTDELQDGMIGALEDRALEDIQTGDILLMDGHIALVFQLFHDQFGAVTHIGIAEELPPTFRVRYVMVEEMQAYLDYYSYQLKANTLGTAPRRVGSARYAEDILFEFGNNAYVTKEYLGLPDSGLRFYIPDGEVTEVYWRYKATDAEDWPTETVTDPETGEETKRYVWNTIALSGCDTLTVNGATTYDLSAVTVSGGEILTGLYDFTTSTGNALTCTLKVIDPGSYVIQKNGGAWTLTLSGYDKCTPHQVRMIPLEPRTEGSTERGFDPPEGYQAVYKVDGVYVQTTTDITGDVVTLQGVPEDETFKLCVDYETGMGLKRVLTTAVIGGAVQ